MRETRSTAVRFFFCFFLCVAGETASQTRAATVTLPPVADTTLFETYSDNNFGHFSLVAGTTEKGERSRALVKFNLGTALLPGAVISSVQLTFRVNRVPHAPVTSTFDLHRMLVDWGEGTGGSGTQAKGSVAKANETTWNTRLSPSTDWNGGPGAAAPLDFVDASSASIPLTGSSLVFASTSQLVADVQAWIKDPSTNFGWILISESEDSSGTARRFTSRETPATAPALVITFTTPQVPPAIGAQPRDQTVFPGESAAFTVTASGSSPLTYLWNLNQISLTGETNATLGLSAIKPSDAGSYSVIISNTAGSITSAPAILTVAALPLFRPVTSVGGALNLEFVAQAGHNYLVQYLESLSTTNWLTLTNISAPAVTTSFIVSDPISFKERFYRLETLQAH